MNRDNAIQELVFYTTLGCHLCDQAKVIYTSTLNPEFFRVIEVDIANQDSLIEKYGTRIPVIKQVPTGQELGWPFGPNELVDFLSKS